MFAGYLSGTSVFAADKPIEDGSKITITSPEDGDEVGETIDLKYELTKGSQVDHGHVFVDDVYQKGFTGTVTYLGRGDTPDHCDRAATKDHDLLAAG